MEDCIFCKIINGDIPSKTIHENENIKVIMDINPKTNGHLLVLPKTHYENLFDIDDNILLEIINYIRNNYNYLKERLNCEGLTIAQNNGYGQDVKHYHLHLIPRYTHDNVEYKSNKGQLVEVEDVFNQIKD